MDLVRQTGRLASEVEDALWELVAGGSVTADGFDNLRALIDPKRRSERGGKKRPRHAAGRWALLRNVPKHNVAPVPPEKRIENFARQLLIRWGVLLRDLLARETVAPPWRDLVPILRRMEARGEIRGGRFVAGLTGEQFARPEALDLLRAVRRESAKESETSVAKVAQALLRHLVFIALLLVTGCSDRGALPLAHIDPATAGAITGKVIFSGTAPAMPVIDMSAIPMCERQHHAPQKSEQVVVNPNGTLRNTFVWIRDGLPKASWAPPTESVKLDQNGCVYRPHVLGAMTGQEIEIENSDPLNHNVHAEPAINASWNESQPPRAEKKFKRFDLQEILFPVTCSVHPWMRAYISVVAHPFFAVTAEDGTFTLKSVPPGNYTVEAIHEKYGRKQAQVTVGPSESKAIDFNFAG